MNSSLRVAAIVGDRLYQGLTYEAELLLLTPEQGENILRYGKPDFLIVESCLLSVTGHWQSMLIPGTSDRTTLTTILTLAEKLNIPTLFWFTQDHAYHNYYQDIIGHFDYVFCSDHREVDLLQKTRKNIHFLAPAVQTAIFNPFKVFLLADRYDTGVLFDGIIDLLRSEEDQGVLKSLRKYNLSIIDSNSVIYANKLDQLEDLKPHILGCVNQQNRLMALKYANMVFSSGKSQLSQTLQQWMMLEAAACRLPVVFWGSLSEGDIRKNILLAETERDDVLTLVDSFQHNPLYRERVGHQGWREVCQNHTYSHRVREICNVLGITHNWNEFPLVTVIIPTFRTHLIKKCIKQFDEQTYPNKELVLVLNTDCFSKDSAIDIVGSRTDIRIYIVPPERVEGGCLNFAITAARGEFCIKMDDDDLYGNNFVYDMILNQQAIDADVFGKACRFMHFEDDDTTYARKDRPQLTVIPPDQLLTAHIGGGSLSGRTTFFRENKYSDLNIASTDTCYYCNTQGKKAIYALVDDMGFIMERDADVSHHSWKKSSAEIKQQMRYICNGIPEDVLA